MDTSDNGRTEGITARYRAEGKGLPPRPVRVSFPGWAGDAGKRMEHGSDPQPWHCRAFVQAAMYGLELLFPYENECRVVNDGGTPRIDWDYRNEPGAALRGDEMGFNEPRPPQFYTFNTLLDIEAPPGHVLQTQPHPRFFTDATGTVPLPLIAQVQSEWYPRTLFAVFKIPPAGHQHVFRKGEPYMQVIFVPAGGKAAGAERMTAEAEAKRRWLETGIRLARSRIAHNVWLNPRGGQFDDHYKVLERTFATAGTEGVEAQVREAIEAQQRAVPQGLTVAQYLALAREHRAQGRHLEARDVYVHLRHSGCNGAAVAHGMGSVAAALGLLDLAHQALAYAVKVEPQCAEYRADFGMLLLKMGRYSEAESHLRAAMALGRNDPQTLDGLRQVIAGQGQPSDLPPERGPAPNSPPSLSDRPNLSRAVAQYGSA